MFTSLSGEILHHWFRARHSAMIRICHGLVRRAQGMVWIEPDYKGGVVVQKPMTPATPGDRNLKGDTGVDVMLNQPVKAVGFVACYCRKMQLANP
jgi:hypothetical protein